MDLIKKALNDTLKYMDIPLMRRELTPDNLRWLSRNLHFKNRENADFPSAVYFINTLLFMQGW